MMTHQLSTRTDYVQYVNTLKFHNHLYWHLNKPEISDEEFDAMYFAVQQYEQQHPEDILPDSPTRTVGSEAGEHTIPHRVPMLSTQKSKTIEEVIKWMKSTSKAAQKVAKYLADQHIRHANSLDCNTFSLEWKYDGTSCSIVYQDGILIEASTRGDTKAGLGKDILHHVLNMNTIPCRLYREDGFSVPGRVEIRGEIIMFDKDLAHFKDIYADTRTAAASILNKDVASDSEDKHLSFCAWQLITDDDTIKIRHDFPSSAIRHSFCMAILKQLGFSVIEPCLVETSDVEHYIKMLTEQRPYLGIPTDGLVIKLNDKRIWDGLGRTDHHPKYALAYKFQPQGAETVIRNIEITIGDTGKRTPVAYFDPVSINGKTYTKASLGSEAVMEKKGIYVGSRVEVVIANDVIPKVERVINAPEVQPYQPQNNSIYLQFVNLKKKHSDAVLLFRTGDFYETIASDAEIASKVLGITLTKSSAIRDEQGNLVQLAGFPYHALDTYLPKLIRAGHRVAICDICNEIR